MFLIKDLGVGTLLPYTSRENTLHKFNCVNSDNIRICIYDVLSESKETIFWIKITTVLRLLRHYE